MVPATVPLPFCHSSPLNFPRHRSILFWNIRTLEHYFKIKDLQKTKMEHLEHYEHYIPTKLYTFYFDLLDFNMFLSYNSRVSQRNNFFHGVREFPNKED